jgi:predicted heme/steroid binding protein
MKNKWVIAGIAIVIIIAGIVVFKSKPSTPVDQSNVEVVDDTTVPTTDATTGEVVTPTPVTTGITAAPGAKTFTLADVAKHNSQSSCYSAVNGVVYDLTSWITRHPGGEREILSICGKDGSSAFNGQHSGQGKPETMLASFKIGTLAK